MLPQEFSLSTGSVYRFVTPDIIHRLDVTLSLANAITDTREFGSVGVEIMLLQPNHAERVIGTLQENNGIRHKLDDVRSRGGHITIHADRPMGAVDQLSGDLVPRCIDQLHLLQKATGAEHIVWHSGWGSLSEIAESGLAIAFENDDHLSSGAKTAAELTAIAESIIGSQFVMDTAHQTENFTEAALGELDATLSLLGTSVVEYHVSATVNSQHVSLAERPNEIYRDILSMIPYNSLCVIESPIPGTNPFAEIMSELAMVADA
jgi:hypothetical protein